MTQHTFYTIVHFRIDHIEVTINQIQMLKNT